ncbi:MAG: right-handed parallel beta-helix repeat-containing protein [Arenicella sp.]
MMKLLFWVGFLLVTLSTFFNTVRAQQTDSILDFIPAIILGQAGRPLNPVPQPPLYPSPPVNINFSVQLPAMPNTREYSIELERWDIPNDRTQPLKTTDNLQAAIDWAFAEGYSRVIVPDGNYLIGKFGNAIYQKGIVLSGNTELVLGENTIIEMAGNDKWNYCVIAITGRSNIIIRGGTLKGDRDTHTYTPRNGGSTAHDEGHGICIQNGAHRVLVQDMTIKNMTGDGSLLVTNVSDVTFRGNDIFNNRRQGISIVGGTRVNIEDNEIHHIKGTSPQFGIDIEGAGRIDRDISIHKNYFHHNRGGDIVSSTGRNVFIQDNIMEQGDGSSYIDGPLVTWPKTDNVIRRNTITMTSGSVNGRLGYIQYSGGGNRGHNRVTYVYDNICNGCGMYMYDAAYADIRRNKFLGYFLALKNFKNATVIDNTVTSSLYCWSYRIRNTTGRARGNTYNGQLVNLPLSNRPWTTPCLR